MRETTVKCLVVVARKKKYYTGQTVSETQFAPGKFDALIASGHLNPVGFVPEQEENKETQEVKLPPPNPLLPGLKTETQDTGTDELGNEFEESEDKEEEANSDLSVAQLRKELKERGIPFKQTDKREDLLKLLAVGK